MAEYIKREDVHLALDNHYFTGELSLRETIDSVSSADVVERKTGKWIQKEDPYGFFDTIPVCSECGHTTKMRETYNYCPNCGCAMEGEDDEQNN